MICIMVLTSRKRTEMGLQQTLSTSISKYTYNYTVISLNLSIYAIIVPFCIVYFPYKNHNDILYMYIVHMFNSIAFV